MQALDIDQLKTFLAVEKTLSFTQAADRVAKTQSAVSMQIKRLEETVGKTLFNRLGRSIELTDDGQKLVAYAREIVETSNRALAAFDDQALNGSIRLGITDDYCERFLPLILADFSEANPLVEVEVRCGPTSEIDRMINNNEVDVGLVTHNEAGARSELARREPLVWVTSWCHGQHTLDPLPLGVGSARCTWRKQAINALDRTKMNYRIVCSSSSGTVNIAAVLAGLTISIFPESTLRPGMRVLTEKEGFPSLAECEIGVMRRGGLQSSVGEALIDHILTSLENLQPREFLLDQEFWDGQTKRSARDIGGPMIAQKNMRKRPGQAPPG